MGIVNVTPDSFADGAHRLDPARAVDDALGMVDAGADILDVGGESTRPGADPVGVAEELARVLPVVDALTGRAGVPVSIDTSKADVAQAALERGVTIVNDISGLRYDPALADVVAARGAALVLAHTRGRSREMYREATYVDLSRELVEELSWSVERAVAAGVARNTIILDPGIGFAKQAEQSYAALGQLDRLRALDRPILVGPSRKSFLSWVLGDRPPSRREWGTAAAVAVAAVLGAHMVRVHGVREMVDVVRVVDEIRAHRERVAGDSATPTH